MKAYEIVNGMIDTLDIFLESDGSESEAEVYLDVMTFLKEELKNKSSNILKYIRNLELESKLAKEEADRLQKVSKVKANKIKNLKNYLINTLTSLDKRKIETDLGSYGLRKSSKIEIIDINKIPKEFLKTKTEITVDKLELGKAIKKEGEVEGAKVLESFSLQIR